MKILILSSSYKSYATQRILKEAEKRGHEVIVLDPKKLYLYISNSEHGYDKIYDGYYDDMESIYEREYDAVICRVTNTDYASFLIQHLSKNLNIYSTASADGLRIASDKLLTQQNASINGIKIPKTILFNNAKHLEQLADKVGAYPLILKTRKGSKGIGVNLINDRNTLVSVIQTITKYEPKLILQEFIKSRVDYRAIVIGGTVVAAMKRISATKAEFRANLSQGGIGEKVILTEEEQDFCVKSARMLNLDFCGVDFMKKGEENILIEVNGNPGFKIEKITKSNIAIALIKHIEQVIDNKNTLNTECIGGNDKQLKQISKELSQKKVELEVFTKNKVVLNAFDAFKGEIVEYTDVDGNKKTTEVKSINDVYSIIFNTLNMN